MPLWAPDQTLEGQRRRTLVPTARSIPREVAGLVLWVRPESLPAAAAEIAQWDDHSGRGNHATHTTSGERPSRVDSVLDGYPVSRWDGSNDRLLLLTSDLLAATSGAGSIMVTAVVKFTPDAVVRQVLAISNGLAGNSVRFKCGQRAAQGWALSARRDDAVAAQNLESATTTDSSWHVVTWQVDWQNSDAFIWVGDTQTDANTAFLTDGTVSATSAVNAAIGARHDGLTEFFAGDLAELCVYVTASKVTDADRQLVRDYLYAKFPTAAPSGAATVTPAVIAAAAALPQPAVGVGTAPSALASSAAVPQPAVGVGVAPAAAGATVSVPQPAVGVGAAPAAIAAVAALPLPDSVGQGATIVTPATLAALTGVPQPAVGVGAAPAVAAALAGLPQPAVGVGTAPAALAALAALPQPAVGVGEASAVIAAVVALPQPAVGVGTAPAVIPAVAALPASQRSVGAAPAVIPVVVALPLATAGEAGGGGATVTPAAFAAVAALPQALVGVGVTPTPVVVLAEFPDFFGDIYNDIYGYTVAVSVGVAPAVIAAAAALPQATIAVHATALPAAVAAVAALPKANIGVGVAPAVIVVLVALPLPERVGPPAGANINPPGPTMVGLVVVEQDAVLGATTLRGVMEGSIG